MVSVTVAKTLLIVACALGAIQGLMTLIGGILATKDNNKDAGFVTAQFLGSIVDDTKYNCGGILVGDDFTSNGETDDSCDEEHMPMDRGWFYRQYKLCGSLPVSISANSIPKGFCDLHGYKLVLAYAIACGAGWIISAIVVIVALATMKKLVAFIAGALFAAFYIVFIVLFALVWHSVRKVNRECLNKACKEVEKRGKRSSFEFLAYSICSFVLILLATIFCFLAAPSLDDCSGTPKSSAAVWYGSNVESTDRQESRGPVTKNGKLTSGRSAPKKPTDVSPAGRPYIYDFRRFNKYIVDRNRMQRYSDRKFEQADTSNSGVLSLPEFKKFVTAELGKEGLPPPSDQKIETLMKRYSADGTTLEKEGFKQFLLEIFIESREAVITRYAADKANSWKPAGMPSKKDTSQLDQLEDVLQSSGKFITELASMAGQAGKSQGVMYDVDDVVDVLKVASQKYRLPTFNRNEITEIMFDMQRDTIEYDTYDFHMCAFAVLCIGRDLLK